MMKYNIFNRIKTLMWMGLLFSAVSLSAQSTLKTGYFLEGNVFRYRLNPAFMGSQNFFALPVLGNLSISSMGNVGLSNFVYTMPGSDDLTTFMNSSVDVNEFLGDLNDDNTFNLNLDVTIFSLGFFAFGGFNTVDVGLHSRTGASLPYDMLKFMKVMGDEHYSFSDAKARTKNYLDVAFGHSRKIDDALTVGGRVKLLFGLAYADVAFDHMDISMTGDKWEIAASGESNIALGGAYSYSDELTIGGKKKIDGYKDAGFGLRGFGMGLDLGASCDLSEAVTDGLTVSLALNDLGFISWNKTANASVSPQESYVFNGFSDMTIHDDGNKMTLDDQFENLRDDLENFFNLEDKGEKSKSTGIGATLNIGAEYKMPFYKRMSVGGLFTHCFDDVYSWSQGSLMVNVSPLDYLDFALSGSVSNMGGGFGALANIHLTGFNFFVGTDCFIGKVGKQYIPLDNMNASFSFGITIPFGVAMNKQTDK